MYSVKPGRGPSAIGVIAGIFAIIIGIGWTFGALSMGAPPFFALFGVVFCTVAGINVVYNTVNTVSKDRMSSLDITQDGEESDPIANLLGHNEPGVRPVQSTSYADPHEAIADAQRDASEAPRKIDGDFCPYCGAEVQDDFDFCPKCGKDI